MDGLIDLFFAPARFWMDVICPAKRASCGPAQIIHISDARRARMRRRVIRRAHLGF